MQKLLQIVALAAATTVAHGAFQSHFPFTSIYGNLTLEEADTIMRLVSIPENSNTQWWTNYDYCEDIGDGRGFTVSLVGFCSGTYDLQGVLEDVQRMNASHPLAKYVAPVTAANGTATHKGMENMCADIAKYNDNVWKQAVWNGIFREYWNPAMDWVAAHKFTTTLSKGWVFDVALNAGWEGLEQILTYMNASDAKADEITFMRGFMEARKYVVVHVDPSTNDGQTDRMDMWLSILQTGNYALKRPLLNLVCYKSLFQITEDADADAAYEQAHAYESGSGSSTPKPTTAKPTPKPTTAKPTPKPTTAKPTPKPTTAKPTPKPTTAKPTPKPTTAKPTPKPTTTKTSKPTPKVTSPKQH